MNAPIKRPLDTRFSSERERLVVLVKSINYIRFLKFGLLNGNSDTTT